VPALLPDGKAAPSSISKVLEARGDVIDSKIFELEVKEVEED
jgi:NADH-quinone oxidoreductase subunit J